MGVYLDCRHVVQLLFMWISMNNRYVSRAADGRAVTNDTRTEAALTCNMAICYVWESKDVVEREPAVNREILETPLIVEVYVAPPTAFLRR